LPTISAVVAEAFYEPVGPGLFRPTEHTIGPWSLDDQHAGPPSALLVRAIEGVVPPIGGRLSRVTVDLLRGVPVAEVLQVRARILRPGRSVQLAGADLLAGGQSVARATAWWHASTDTAAVAGQSAAAPPRPTAGRPVAPLWSKGGYLAAMDWLPVTGGFDRPGPMAVWARMRYPLVSGEQATGLQRLLAVADSGNGVSWVLDLDRWLFINTELTVHVLRQPSGEWICLDAATLVGSDGTGVAISRLSDQDGEVGRGAQALVVRPRTP
jgi:Thioesterase-like superfamily